MAGTPTKPPRVPLADRLPLELLSNLTLRELRGKYKRSVLGWAWSIINPVMNLAVYGVVFGAFLRVDPPVGNPSGLVNYPFFLVTGLLAWAFMTNSLGGATQSLVANEGLITKVYFPRAVLPISIVFSHLVGYLIELGVLLVAISALTGNFVLPWVPLLIPVIILQFGFVLGMSLFLAVGNAYFRDVSHFVGIFLNAWFYATPILYPEDLPPDWADPVIKLNPMTHFVRVYRDLLYDLRFPTAREWAILCVLCFVPLVLGSLFFRKHEARLAEEL